MTSSLGCQSFYFFTFYDFQNPTEMNKRILKHLKRWLMSIVCTGMSIGSLENNANGRVKYANLKEQFNNICKILEDIRNVYICMSKGIYT